MQELAIRRAVNETTVNENFAPSIDSSTLVTNENVLHPDDESSEDNEN